MPSKRMSSACVDYVPALCTHRPSLLPIEWLSEASGLAQGGGQLPPRAGKLSKLGHLEEVKVVTRFPLVNQRKDHYRDMPFGVDLPPCIIYSCCFGRPPSGPRHLLLESACQRTPTLVFSVV